MRPPMLFEPRGGMKAVILAGGRGTRLRPITDIIPKPLIPLAGRPIIEWQIMHLAKFGIRSIIVSSGYKSRQIENFLSKRSSLGISAEYSVESEPLGTGGALKRAGSMISDASFLALNGDVITNIDISRLVKKDNCIAAVPLRTKFGVINYEDDIITEFLEKRTMSSLWINAGLYHLSKDIIRDLPTRGNIEDTLFPEYAKKKLLRLERFPDAEWISIDSNKDLEECSAKMEALIHTND